MARITSKTNWTASDRPLAPDFNRIESNNEQAFNEIDAEESARIAAISAETSARIAAISAETSARIAGDNGRLSISNLGPRTFSTVSPTSSDYIVPSGTYYIHETSGAGRILVRDGGGTWRGGEQTMSGMSLVISDGVNIACQAGGGRVYQLIKIA